MSESMTSFWQQCFHGECIGACQMVVFCHTGLSYNYQQAKFYEPRGIIMIKGEINLSSKLYLSLILHTEQNELR